MLDAAEPAGKAHQDGDSQWIVFSLDQTEYVLRSAQIAQMEMVEKITPVPNSPAFVRGIAYLRGEVVPVIDLRIRLGMAPVEVGLASRTIVVELDGRRVGLLVDRAREVLYAGEADILPTPEAATGGGTSHIEGVLIRGNRLLLVLALDTILQTEASLLPLDTVNSVAREIATRAAENREEGKAQ
jgi:purine-binding chemotaxis protein CheW